MLSEAKVSHLSHLIVRGMKEIPRVHFLQGEEAVVRKVQQLIKAELRLNEEIDGKVRSRLTSYTRRILQGSQEWDILYKKFFEEELKRRRRL